MKRFVPFVLVVVISMGSSGVLTSSAGSPQEAIETGRLLALLLDAGRVTIGKNQALINDPAKGDKGFTPEVFAQQVIAEFKARTGIDLNDLDTQPIPEMAKPLLARLLEESKKTVATYQPVINIKGVKYKGLIPATFGTETSFRFQNWSRVYLKQTAPDRFLRNPRNKADAFELAMMEKLADPSYPRDKAAILSEIDKQGRSVRIMLPLYYGQECIGCHGGPKGERDITGHLKEGGKLGEFAGAISVKLSLK